MEREDDDSTTKTPGEMQPCETLSHEQFMRRFLQAEREILRYVMALVPNVNDARDVMQDTAAALWKEIGKYDPQRPFIPWACRFALNEARRFLRKEVRRRRWLDEETAAVLEARRVEIAPLLDERRAHLADCLGRLPVDQRRLVQGYYFDEDSVDALADQLGRKVESIYKTLQRVRQSLHDCIERKLQAAS